MSNSKETTASDAPDNRAELAQGLVNDFGWSKEQAEAFLDNKIGTRMIQVDGRLLPAVMEKLSKIGIPFGPVAVKFLVPERRWKEFEEAAQEAIAPKGVFVVKAEQATLMGTTTPADPTKLN